MGGHQGQSRGTQEVIRGPQWYIPFGRAAHCLQYLRSGAKACLMREAIKGGNQPQSTISRNQPHSTAIRGNPSQSTAISINRMAISRTPVALSRTQRSISRTQRALSRTHRAINRTHRSISRTHRARSGTHLMAERAQHAPSRARIWRAQMHFRVEQPRRPQRRVYPIG
jgi:hypothetical protein